MHLFNWVDLARIGLAPRQCECRVVPLDYRPLGHTTLTQTLIFENRQTLVVASQWRKTKRPRRVCLRGQQDCLSLSGLLPTMVFPVCVCRRNGGSLFVRWRGFQIGRWQPWYPWDVEQQVPYPWLRPTQPRWFLPTTQGESEHTFVQIQCGQSVPRRTGTNPHHRRSQPDKLFRRVSLPFS